MRKQTRLGIDPAQNLGPIPPEPETTEFAPWKHEFHGLEFGDDQYICRDGQCVPKEEFEEHLFGGRFTRSNGRKKSKMRG